MSILNIKNRFEIIIDNTSIHVINYLKVIDINNNYIIIGLPNKEIKINGKDLMIRKLDEKELLIIGSIKGIDFVEKD